MYAPVLIQTRILFHWWFNFYVVEVGRKQRRGELSRTALNNTIERCPRQCGIILRGAVPDSAEACWALYKLNLVYCTQCTVWWSSRFSFISISPSMPAVPGSFDMQNHRKVSLLRIIANLLVCGPNYLKSTLYYLKVCKKVYPFNDQAV